MPRTTILIIEDEEDIQQLLCYHIVKNNMHVLCADTAEQGLELYRKNNIDLILLDLMLPKMSGLTFCKRIREIEKDQLVPIIILTAKSEEEDIITGLESGADDYIIKPFSPKILIARIKAHLRRREDKISQGTPQKIILDMGLEIDLEQYTVTVNSKKIELTVSEFNILKLLASNPQRVFSREQIIENIRGTGYEITRRAVDVQIHGLRKKLGMAGKYIETVRGIGYKFNAL